MSCPPPDALARAFGGTGDPADRQAVFDHAAECDECHDTLLVMGASTASGPSVAMATPLPASAAAAAVTIDRYQLGAELGRGAMGVVYAARDPELDRDVALKVLRPSMPAARLRREAQALARLAHPNVVRVYDVGEHDGQAFVAMELVRGANLRVWLRTPRAVDEVLSTLLLAGEGLAAAHRAALIHRDIKPDNVFVADDGGVLVGDFGLARSADPPPEGDAGSETESRASRASGSAVSGDVQLTATGAMIGTPAYMAPEQSDGDATAASDQFGFCVMAWEALFGLRPFHGATLLELLEHTRAGVITTPPSRGEVPAHVEEALRRGLSTSPEARFPSMDALLAALAPRRKRRWLLPVAALAVAAVGGAVVLAMTIGASGGAADREASCRAAGEAIAPDWTPEIAARVRERVDGATASALAHYVDRWRARRIDACRADVTPALRDGQVACLDRARISFRQTVAGVTAASTSLQASAITRVLPGLDRCAAGGAPSAPRPEIAAQVAALDERIAAAELGALTRVPRATRAEVAALATEAAALGFAPQIHRVKLLDGSVAALTGDVPAAVAIFREVMVAAEADADDFLRARAGAHLALALARQRDPETGVAVTAARAALARAGQDASTEILLLEAEGAFAMGRGDYAAAGAAHERIIELTLAELGPDAPGLAEAYVSASGAFALAGDQVRAAAHSRAMTELTQRTLRAGGAPIDGAAILTEDTNASFVAGDFAKVREITQRQIVYLRSMPVQEPMYMAQTMATLARAYDLDGDCNQALRWYGEAEAILRRPLAEIAGSTTPDPAGAAVALVDSLLGQGSCVLELGRADEAVRMLRAAESEAVARGAATAADLPYARRALGQALTAAGQHRDAIALLVPIVDGFPASTPRAFARGATAFALAQSLWSVGGIRDRERAHALVADAERELEAAEKEASDPTQPATRIVASKARKQLAAIDDWRAAHPAPR